MQEMEENPELLRILRLHLSFVFKSQLIAEIIHFGFLAISFYELVPKNIKISTRIGFTIKSLTHTQLDIFVQLSLKHRRIEFFYIINTIALLFALYFGKLF
ncbi:hypothetical protein QTP88_008520 [Uroleucon formosanum]